MNDLNKAYRKVANILQRVPGRIMKTETSEEEADILDFMSYPPLYETSVKPAEDIEKLEREEESSVDVVESWKEGRNFAIINWKNRFISKIPDHQVMAFIDGVQRTIPGKEILLKNGAIGVTHIAVVSVGALFRDNKRLWVMDDGIVQKIAILGPFEGMVNTGVEGDASALVELASIAKERPNIEDILLSPDPLVVIDTTRPEKGEETAFKKRYPHLSEDEVKKRIHLEEVGLFDIAMQRRRAKNRVGRLRQVVECAGLEKLGELPKDNEWIVLDGTTVDLTVQREKTQAVFGHVVAVSKTLRTRFLSPNQIAKVLHMREGQRCSVFQFSEDHDDYTRNVRMKPRLSWYMRLHSKGVAGHLSDYVGLVRLEIHQDMEQWSNISISEIADIFSLLVFHERVPIPSEDRRWPSLLYPVLVVERTLRARLPSIQAIQAMLGA